ncbi:MAG: hypothetical protein ACYTG7_19110 [Planctomycetota bacterium]|jgi:multidrug efflux pump subunit AcrA (membrane-fusion protein)
MMNKKPLLFLLFSAVLTVIGLLGGWFAAHQKLVGSAGTHADAECEDDAHAQTQDQNRVSLSPQTLENLGVTIAEAGLTTFVKYREIPAIVTETSATYQPVFAPVAGRIQEIRAVFGSMVQGGEVMVTLIRERLERPQLTLTEGVLKPATEEFHKSMGELRSAARRMEIVQTEIDRLEEINQSGDSKDGLPIIPQKDLIDLRYQLAQFRQDLDNVKAELRLHGLSDEQIAGIQSGEEAVVSLQFWHDALVRNGLWPPMAEEIYNTLPEKNRNLPWTVATIGELVAMDLAGRDLISWFRDEPGASEHMISIGGMLLAGSSLADVRSLHDLGALEPIVELRAPASARDWDVKKLFIKPGEQVEAGSTLLTLANPRQMYLRVESVGGETAALLSALKDDLALEALPLVEGTGPPLGDLHILNLVNEEASEGTVAYIPVQNEPLKTATGDEGMCFRSWQLRDRLRYMLRIPIEKDRMTDVYVVPADAITDVGPDKVVFIQDGDGFKAQKVVLLYLDQDVAVLSKDSEIFPGDFLVEHGAFGLGLAMNAGGQVMDEHAGHSH